MNRQLVKTNQHLKNTSQDHRPHAVPGLPDTDMSRPNPVPVDPAPSLLVPHDQGMGARRDRDILEALLLVTGRGLVLVPVPGLAITRNVLEVEAALEVEAILPVAGGQEGQRTEVADGHVHEVGLMNEGESHVPAAGPGLVPVTGEEATGLVLVPEIVTTITDLW